MRKAMKIRLALSSVVVLSTILLCGNAHAVLRSTADGVVLIDQVRGINGGVTPGDSRGFPVIISEPGSYRLSGNLTITKVNTNGIEITVGDVTLDLNGFTIVGPSAGSGIGVHATEENVTVKNGIVRGMGLDGINLTGTNSRVENIQAYSNGGLGISAATGTGNNNTSTNNGGAGIQIGNGNNNTSVNNGGDGIDSSGTVNNSVSTNNGANGISAVTAIGDTASGNTGIGITAATANNDVANNNGGDGIDATTAIGNTASDNTGNGIAAVTAIGNTSSGNKGYGLVSSGGYANNVFQGNNGVGGSTQQVSGVGVQMGISICNGLTCP